MYSPYLTIYLSLFGANPYKSPTDMGVNMIRDVIIDEEVCVSAAKQEVIRRLYTALCEQRKGLIGEEEVNKLQLIMRQLELSDDDRPVLAAARSNEQTGAPAAAIQLLDGTIITSKTSSLLGASAALILNAVKHMRV